MKNIVLKSTNENGMRSELRCNNLKTEVRFGFDPERMKFIGTIKKEDLLDNT